MKTTAAQNERGTTKEVNHLYYLTTPRRLQVFPVAFHFLLCAYGTSFAPAEDGWEKRFAQPPDAARIPGETVLLDVAGTNTVLRFQLASWAKDDDEVLDLKRVSDIRIGWGGYLGVENEKIQFSVAKPHIGAVAGDAK